MKLRVIIDQAFLVTAGAGTLLGTTATVSELRDLTEVELFFPQTTTAWRKENGGPDTYIMPEFSIPLLIEDILKLQEMGIEVTISMEGF